MIKIDLDNRSLFGQKPRYLFLGDIKNRLDIMRQRCIEKYGFDAEYRYYGLKVDVHSFLLGILVTFDSVIDVTIELHPTKLILKDNITKSEIAEIDVIPEDFKLIKVEATYDPETINAIREKIENYIKE